MTSPTKALPIGIRNNNPAHLRQAHGPDTRTLVVEGFASFATMRQGVCNFFWFLHGVYRVQSFRTLPAIVSRLAPATEHDIAAYTRALQIRLGLNPLKATTQDTQLDLPWRAIDFARAVFEIESGLAPVAAPYYGEWIDPLTMVGALGDTAKWDV